MLIQAVDQFGFLNRLRAGGGISRRIGFARTIKGRQAVGARPMLGALDRTRCRLVMKLSADGLWSARTGIRTRRRTLDGALDLRDPRRARTRLRVYPGNKKGNDQKRNIRSAHNPSPSNTITAPRP